MAVVSSGRAGVYYLGDFIIGEMALVGYPSQQVGNEHFYIKVYIENVTFEREPFSTHSVNCTVYLLHLPFTFDCKI